MQEMQLRQSYKRLCTYFLISAAIFAAYSTRVPAQTDAKAVNATTERDGQHDFDFLLGSWKIHLKRRLHPLTGSNTWVEFDGTDVARKIWDGANLDEFETDGPSDHIEGLTLRTYNPKTHQWSLYWANRKDGSMSINPQIGEFKDGRGEFYAQDTLNGKLIYVRYVWSNTTTNTPHFEQAFSNDGGKTWEVNWITDQTRVPDDSIKLYDPPVNSNAGTQATGARDGQHDFDPLIGGWKFDLKVRQHPLTGSTTWVEFRGNGACHKVWNGRANLDQIALNGPSGPVEGLTLRLYNPQTRQWSLYWANRKDGKVVVPQIGQFKDGHGEFYAQDMLDGKSIFVRFDWTNMTTDSPHFEQAFSDDGGKTWEVNWTSNQTKIDGESAKAHEERWEQLAAMPPPDLQGANAWYQQGVAFARLGNCAKAIPSLERGFQQAPLTAAF